MKLKKLYELYSKIALNKLGYVGGQIEITSQCFQHCLGCISWKQDTVMFSLEQLQNTCRQLATFTTFEHLTLTGGDPRTWEPLDEFLEWFGMQQFKFKLQLNTALARPIKDVLLWQTVYGFKVSMDACTNETYQAIRHDPENTPQTIMERCWELSHPRLALNVTVYPENQHEFYDLMLWINKEYQNGLPLRKVMITAAIGSEACRGDQNEEFYSQWEVDKERILENKDITVPNSFSESHDEDELMVRDVCNSSEILDTRCWAGLLGFHIKPNGDLYPCCIVGGEVSETLEEHKIGNIFSDHIANLYANLCPDYRYARHQACRDNCMYKQLQINITAEQARNTVLALP